VETLERRIGTHIIGIQVTFPFTDLHEKDLHKKSQLATAEVGNHTHHARGQVARPAMVAVVIVGWFMYISRLEDAAARGTPTCCTNGVCESKSQRG